MKCLLHGSLFLLFVTIVSATGTGKKTLQDTLALFGNFFGSPDHGVFQSGTSGTTCKDLFESKSPQQVISACSTVTSLSVRVGCQITRMNPNTGRMEKSYVVFEMPCPGGTSKCENVQDSTLFDGQYPQEHAKCS